MKKIKKGMGLIGLIIALFFCVGIVVFTQKLGKELGKRVGTLYGGLVGTAVGSYNGFTEGWEKGKENGISAVDTITEMKNSFDEVAKLEVLVSSFKLNDYHEFGNKYAALYLLKADAVFTIDLSKASVDANENGTLLYIRVSQPEVTVYIDDRSVEKMEEYQRKFFNGSAEDGFDAYINSRSNLEVNAQNSIANDENLMRSARNSAEKQIRQLAERVFVNGGEPLIVWE